MVVKIIDKQAKRTYQYINQSTPNLNYVESSCRRVYISINNRLSNTVCSTKNEREREKIPSSMDMVVCVITISFHDGIIFLAPPDATSYTHVKMSDVRARAGLGSPFTS